MAQKFVEAINIGRENFKNIIRLARGGRTFDIGRLPQNFSLERVTFGCIDHDLDVSGYFKTDRSGGHIRGIRR